MIFFDPRAAVQPADQVVDLDRFAMQRCRRPGWRPNLEDGTQRLSLHHGEVVRANRPEPDTGETERVLRRLAALGRPRIREEELADANARLLPGDQDRSALRESLPGREIGQGQSELVLAWPSRNASFHTKALALHVGEHLLRDIVGQRVLPIEKNLAACIRQPGFQLQRVVVAAAGLLGEREILLAQQAQKVADTGLTLRIAGSRSR